MRGVSTGGRLAALVFAAGLAASCRAPRTEIVLRVDTNIPQGSTPDALSDVRVELTSVGDTAPFYTTTQHLDPTHPQDYPPLPDTLGINAHNNAAGRGVTINVFGVIDGSNRVRYTAIVPFSQGHITFLNAFLAGQCVDFSLTCGATETCVVTDGVPSCVDAHMTSLPDFDAAVLEASTGVDSGVPTDVPTDIPIRPDGDGGCAAGLVECGDACVDTAGDTLNCGACGHNCATAANTIAGSASCVSGVCHFACVGGFGDCDGVAGNGCEADTTSTTHCGACMTTCVAPQVCSPGDAGTSMCARVCPPGTTSCLSACTDTMTDPMNCGGCAQACATDPHGNATCTAGVCGVTCATGYHQCGGAGPCIADTDITSCGPSCTHCGDPGHATGTCNGTACGMTCLPGFQDCDGNPANGCEADLTSTLHCGGCTTVCAGATPVCSPVGATYHCTATCTPGVACNTGNLCTFGTTVCGGDGSMPCPAMGNQPAGTGCGAGHVCNGSGTCVACVEGSGCALPTHPCQIGSTTCVSGGPVCHSIGSVAPGTSCGVHQVCDNSGSCIGCTAGMACTPSGNPCATGAIDCSMGSQVCRIQGSVPAGTACPGGTCDGMGACTACVAGAACDPGVCQTGAIVCPASGAGTCMATGSLPGGSPCGAGMVCNGGACIACMTGSACNLGECVTATTDCSSGVPMCMQTGFVTSGTPCGVGVMFCNGMGMCLAPSMDAGVDSGADSGGPDASDDGVVDDDGSIIMPVTDGGGTTLDSGT